MENYMHLVLLNSNFIHDGLKIVENVTSGVAMTEVYKSNSN